MSWYVSATVSVFNQYVAALICVTYVLFAGYAFERSVPLCCKWSASLCTFVIENTSLVPVSSKIMTCMPVLNPQSSSFLSQPSCAVTFSSLEFEGIVSRTVVCADVGGTYMIVMVSLASSESQNAVVHLYVPGGSGEILPSRSGRIVAT